MAARLKLMAKINRVVENLEAEAGEGGEDCPGGAAQSQDLDESAGLGREKQKTPLGVGASL